MKQKNKAAPASNRPISFTSVIAKLMERCILPLLQARIAPFLTSSQAGFCPWLHHRPNLPPLPHHPSGPSSPLNSCLSLASSFCLTHRLPRSVKGVGSCMDGWPTLQSAKIWSRRKVMAEAQILPQQPLHSSQLPRCDLFCSCNHCWGTRGVFSGPPSSSSLSTISLMPVLVVRSLCLQMMWRYGRLKLSMRELGKVQLNNALNGRTTWASDWRIIWNVKKSYVVMFQAATRAVDTAPSSAACKKRTLRKVNESHIHFTLPSRAPCAKVSATLVSLSNRTVGGMLTSIPSSQRYDMQCIASVGSFGEDTLPPCPDL